MQDMYDDINIIEVNEEVVVEEVISVVDASFVPQDSIGMTEAFPAATNIDALNHALLNNREINDQHPITAITGLRHELDEIGSLKTVQSNKIGVANYYKWNDGAYDDVGYFVSIVSKTDTIKICDGTDIFGVVVSDAGFVGNQDGITIDYVDDIVQSHGSQRDNTYGLVVTSGLAEVRCELDVIVGDYIVSNERGYATKSGSNYGYKVLAKETKNGVEYAVILLGVQADVIASIGAELDVVDSRLDAAETNIISAINIANQAYQTANDVSTSNQEMSDKVNDALGVVDDIEKDMEDLETQVGNSVLISAQAKAIAESAAVSAESMRNEALDKGNEALAATSDLRKEYEEKVAKIDADLDKAVSDLETTRDNLQKNIDSAVFDIDALEKDLEPLVTWPNEENPTGVAGFVAKANEDSVTLGGLVKWQGETNESIAGIQQSVSDNEASISSITQRQDEADKAIASVEQKTNANAANITSLTTWQSEANTSITNVEQKATDNEATIKNLTSWQGEASESISSIEQKTNEHESSIKSLTTWKDDASTSITSVEQKASANEAAIANLTEWQDGVNTSISSIEQTTSAHESSIESLTSWQGDAKNSIATVEQKADDNAASINELTTWQGNTNIAMARIEQKADANGAYIHSTVSNMDKYSVGPHSQAYGFTLEQAASVLEKGMIYVPTESVTETYANGEATYERTFTQQYLYMWGVVDGQYRWITVDKNYGATDETNTSSKAVYFTTIEPAVSGNFGYWYTNGDTITGTTGTYEPYTLYKWMSYEQTNIDGTVVKDDNGDAILAYQWVAVATLMGNSSNRAVSQIRQDANSIELRVTNTEGSYAGIRAELTETKSDVQSLAAWTKDADGNQYNLATIKQTADNAGADVALVVQEKDGEKVINAASIVTAVNNSGSSVVIDADKVNLNGYVTVTGLSGGTTSIDGACIQTGTIDAERLNVAEIITVGKLAKKDDIPTDDEITTITNNTISTTNVTATNLKVKSANIDGTLTIGQLPSDVATKGNVTTITEDTISTTNVTATNLKVKAANIDGSLTIGQLPSGVATTDNVTTITNDTIQTTNVVAQNLQVKAANIDGKLTADQINVGDLNALGAKIAGWTINTGSLTASGVGVASSGSYAFWAGSDTASSAPFRIGFDGNGCIGSVKLYNFGIFVGDSASITGNTFSVSNNGNSETCLSPGKLTVSSNTIFSYSSSSLTIGSSTDAITVGGLTISEDILYASSFNVGSLSNGNGGSININSDRGYLWGTWESAAAIKVTSDREKKNTINTISNTYADIFDQLKPVTFKYNDGTSDRLHTGFIAQDVEQAVLDSGLTTQEFAAVCYDVDEHGNKVDYGIRYSELVALNVDQIQKLKARVTELENRLAQFEQQG